jgi:hypothetical protein
MSVKKIAIGMFCVAMLTAGVAEARKLKVKNLPADFPSVDAGGALDLGTTYEGFVKLTVNLNTGRTAITGKARVDNLSGARQVFIDADLAGLPGLITDRYVVNRNGRAEYTGKYQL